MFHKDICYSKYRHYLLKPESTPLSDEILEVMFLKFFDFLFYVTHLLGGEYMYSDDIMGQRMRFWC